MMKYYTLNEIRAHKKDFSKHKKQRNFLRIHPEYIETLKNFFGNLSNSELNHLIDNERGYCLRCNSKDVTFRNHDHGYREHCYGCRYILGGEAIQKQNQNYEALRDCPRCSKVKTINGKICDECNNYKRCASCKNFILRTNFSEFFEKQNKQICNNCELEYFLNHSKLYCDVDCYQFQPCEECGVLFKYLQGGVKNTHCKEHRKRCKWCNSFFNKQGVTCSQECQKNLTHQTNLERYGEINNLNVRGSKKSHKEYWMNMGYGEGEQVFETYLFNCNNSNRFKSYEDFVNHIDENIWVIKNYTQQIQKWCLVNNTKTLEILLDKYVEDNDIKFGNKNVIKKEGLYGNIHYVDHYNELICLRSNLEFYFYLLLDKNDIEFKTNKQYQDSKYYYDFYLPKYNKYIEITGMAGIEKYDKKMQMKEEVFGQVLLGTRKEMKNFINELIKEK